MINAYTGWVRSGEKWKYFALGHDSDHVLLGTYVEPSIFPSGPPGPSTQSVDILPNNWKPYNLISLEIELKSLIS